MILLPGNDFTGAQTYVSNGSAGNLSRVHNLDGSNTSLIFDVHKYLDADGSGTSLECVSDHVDDAFRPLAQFLVANNRKAILSETGGGNTSSCLMFLCNELAFINSRPDAFIGYTAWAAGGFSPIDYNLTMTPKGSAGNFTDQETMRQCVVGTRGGINNGTVSNNSTNGLVASAPPVPVGGQSVVTTAGSARLQVGLVGVLGMMTVFWIL